MALVAWGSLVVFVDLKINGFDLIIDFVGWLMCLHRTRRVQRLQPVVRYARFGALFGALVSVPELVAADTGLVGAIVLSVASLMLVFGTCTGIMESVRNMKVESTANTIRWLTLAVYGLLLVILASGGPGFGTGVPELLLLVIPALALTVWFIVFLFRVQDDVEPVTVR